MQLDISSGQRWLSFLLVERYEVYQPDKTSSLAIYRHPFWNCRNAKAELCGMRNAPQSFFENEPVAHNLGSCIGGR
jgi:hypothetical protein